MRPLPSGLIAALLLAFGTRVTDAGEPCSHNCFDGVAQLEQQAAADTRRQYNGFSDQYADALIRRKEALSTVADYLKSNGVVIQPTASAASLEHNPRTNSSDEYIRLTEYRDCMSIGAYECTLPRGPRSQGAQSALSPRAGRNASNESASTTAPAHISAPSPDLARAAKAYQNVSSGRTLDGIDVHGVDPAVIRRLQTAVEAEVQSRTLARKMEESAQAFRDFESQRATNLAHAGGLASIDSSKSNQSHPAPRSARGAGEKRFASIGRAQGIDRPAGTEPGEIGNSQTNRAAGRSPASLASPAIAADNALTRKSPSGGRANGHAAGTGVENPQKKLVPLRDMNDQDELRKMLRASLGRLPEASQEGASAAAVKGGFVDELVREADQHSSPAAMRERLAAAGFVLSGSETDAEIRRLTAGLDSEQFGQDGIAGADSKDLFQRVHSALARTSISAH